jgi:hypothetical protein
VISQQTIWRTTAEPYKQKQNPNYCEPANKGVHCSFRNCGRSVDAAREAKTRRDAARTRASHSGKTCAYLSPFGAGRRREAFSRKQKLRAFRRSRARGDVGFGSGASDDLMFRGNMCQFVIVWLRSGRSASERGRHSPTKTARVPATR